MTDTTHSILHSAKRFFGGTVLSRISGMLRDMAMAYAFGTQGGIAAFMVAFRFSHLLRRVFGEGALQTAFIPQFEAVRKDDPQKGLLFFRDLFLILTGGLSVLIVAIMAVLGACLLFLDLSAGNYEILLLTFLMMPSLLFICLFGLNASLLQCEHKYFLSGVAPVAFNLIWIAGVLCLQYFPIKEAMLWLSGFVIAACLGQWMITLPAIITLFKQQKMPLIKSVNWSTTSVKGFAKPLCLGILGIAASQINNALDAIFARYAEAEGPALLWYALRIQQLPLALFGIAIAGALMPPLTRAIKNGEHEKYLQFLTFALNRTGALMLPITAVLFVCGDSFVNLIYGRGDFGNASVIGTTFSLWGYSIGLVPMTLTLILAPAFYARNDYRTPTIAATGAMISNVVLNTVFIAWLGSGAAGVAFATSISAFFNCAFLGWMLRSDLKIVMDKAFLEKITQVVVGTVIASTAVLLYRHGLYEVQYPHAFFTQAWDVLVPGGIFAGVLIGFKGLKGLQRHKGQQGQKMSL